MSRTVSSAFKAAVAAQQTGEAVLVLLTIDHEDLSYSGGPGPIYLTSDSVNTVSRGNTHLPFPFQIALPDEREDRPPVSQLIIDNVSREIIPTIRSLTSAPTITLELVLASDPETVEAGPFVFTLKDATYDLLTIAGRLGYEDILNERWPIDDFTPASHPGLF